MPITLTDEMWKTILASKGKEGGKAVAKQAASEAAASPSPSDEDVVYLLMLEGESQNPNWTWWERALDTVVQAAQPAPAMTHIELIVPPPPGNDTDEFHYATYLGKKSGWGSSFGDGLGFYLDPNGNGNSWRAIPVVAPNAARRMRAVCNANKGTPYGSPYRLFDYPFSVPPLRTFAWTLPSSYPSPAHCASLSARCIAQALPEFELPQPAAWYGPSTLYLEAARHARMVSYMQKLKERDTLKSLTEDEEAARAADTLMRGSNDAVVLLTDAECRAGIDLLRRKTINASAVADVTATRTAEAALARALLRWSQINVATRRMPPPPPEPPAEQPKQEEKEEECPGGVCPLNPQSRATSTHHHSGHHRRRRRRRRHHHHHNYEDDDSYTSAYSSEED